MAGAAEAAPSVADVERACLIAYQNADPPRLAEASAWLLALQRSPHIIPMARALFESQYPVVQFFAATSVYAKVRQQWSSMNDEMQSATCTWLFQFLQAQQGTNSFVTSRLCLAIAASAVRSLSVGKWLTVMDDLFALVNVHNSLLPSIVEVLGSMPEEAEASFFTLRERQRIVTALRSGMPAFMALTARALETQSPVELRTKVLTALTKWIRFGGAFDSATLMYQHDALFTLVFAHLTHAPLGRLAADLVMEVQAAPLSPEQRAHLLRRILGLRELFAHAQRTGHADVCVQVARLAAAYGEAHASDVADGSVEAQALTAMLLDCLAHSAHAVAVATLDFWTALAEAICAGSAGTRELYAPVAAQAVRYMLQMCAYPANFTDWAKATEDEDEWSRRRELVAEAVPALLPILGAAYVVMLQQALAQAGGQWTTQEVLLYGAYVVCGTLDARAELAHTEALIAIVQNCCALAPHPFLHLTVYRLLGALGGFLERHPVVAPSVLPVLIAGLLNKALARPAADALEQLTRCCPRALYPHLGTLLEAYVASAASLKADGREVVACAIMQLMACGVELAEVSAQLSSLIAPVLLVLSKLQPLVLTALSARPGSAQTVALLATLTHQLRLLACCFRVPPTAPPGGVLAQAVAAALEHCLPLLQTLFSTYMAHASVMEPLCDLLADALTSADRRAAPMLTGVLPGLATAFQATRLSCCLLPIRAAFKLSAAINSPELRTLLTQVLGAVSQTCMAVFGASAQEQSWCVEAYFELLATVHASMPAVLYSAPFFAAVLALVGVCQTVTEHRAVAAVLDLAIALLSPAHVPQLFDPTSGNEAAALSLLQAVVASVARATCRSATAKHAALLYALFRALPPSVLMSAAPAAISAALAPIDLPFLDKAAVTRAFFAHLQSPVKFNAFVRTFANVCTLEQDPESLTDFLHV